jgi:hypothetical protein
MGALLRRLVFKGKGKMWPTVMWQGTQLVVYYLSDDDEGVVIRETSEIDFDEFFLHLDGGGSIFITIKPTGEGTVGNSIHPALDALRDGEGE